MHLDIPKEKKERKGEKTNLERKLRLIKAKLNNLSNTQIFLRNFVEKNLVEAVKVNKQKQKGRFECGWKKQRDLYLNDKYLNKDTNLKL